MKTKLAVLLIIMSFGLTTAQVRLGLKLGIMATDVNMKAASNASDLEMPTSRTLNFSGGVTLEYEFMKDLMGVRTAVEYAQKGYNVDLNQFKQKYNNIKSIAGDWKVALQYIQVPVSLYYNAFNGLNVNAGAYLGYALGGMEKYNLDIVFNDNSTLSLDDTQNMIPVNGQAPIDLNDIQNQDTPLLRYFNQLDLGFTVGFGYSIKNIYLNVQYQQGLTNLTPDLANEPNFNPSDLLARNNVISIGITYYIPLTRHGQGL